MTTTIQNFYKTTLTRNWSATTGDFNVSTKPTISSGYLVVSPNNTTLREIIKYSATGTNSYGDFITISNLSDRGLGGTTAQVHTIGETLRMNITAEHWNEMQAEIDAIVAGDFIPPGTVGQGILSNGTNWYASDIGEWQYLSKVSYTAENGAKTFSSLPVHGEYKLVVRLYNTTSTDISTEVTLNNITASNYNQLHKSYNGITATFNGGASFKLYRLVTSASPTYFISEMIISGKHRNGIKPVYTTTTFGVDVSDYVLENGSLKSDSNDLSRIDITVTGVCTGTVELWYKDEK